MDRSLWRRHKTSRGKKTSAPPACSFSLCLPSHPLPAVATARSPPPSSTLFLGVTCESRVQRYVPQSAKQCHLPGQTDSGPRSDDATSLASMLILSMRYGDPTSPSNIETRDDGRGSGERARSWRAEKNTEMDRSAANPRTRNRSDANN